VCFFDEGSILKEIFFTLELNLRAWVSKNPLYNEKLFNFGVEGGFDEISTI